MVKRLMVERVMVRRDPDEAHRVATPLELLFDLCFVVAVAQAGGRLAHAVAHGQAGHGVCSDRGPLRLEALTTS